MNSDLERNLGEQPLVALMDKHDLQTGDVADASTEFITRKMVTRARKGRWLTPHVQAKILRALNTAAETEYTLTDLFTY
jgi:hypothetical protein